MNIATVLDFSVILIVLSKFMFLRKIRVCCYFSYFVNYYKRDKYHYLSNFVVIILKIDFIPFINSLNTNKPLITPISCFDKNHQAKKEWHFIIEFSLLIFQRQPSEGTCNLQVSQDQQGDTSEWPNWWCRAAGMSKFLVGTLVIFHVW